MVADSGMEAAYESRWRLLAGRQCGSVAFAPLLCGDV